MPQIKITEKQFKKVLNEIIGFRTTYEDEALSELENFIKVVQGPIMEYSKTKSFQEGPITQRIFQLVTEGGELHALTQELIDLLESLDDKPKPGEKRIGFRFKNRQED